jgi:hypothetical protein
MMSIEIFSIKLPPYTLAGFDLTTFNSNLLSGRRYRQGKKLKIATFVGVEAVDGGRDLHADRALLEVAGVDLA